METIQNMMHEITTTLSHYYKNQELAQQHAWWIVCSITGKSKQELLLEPSIFLDASQQARLTSWLDKITKEHMPLAYLIGIVPFLDLELCVQPPLLIPRPETEEWVGNLCARLKELRKKNISILDIGTGTGCIALALAQAMPESTITAIDINPQALALAQENAAKNGITNVNFVRSNLFENVAGSFDLIVSNPPYISCEEFIDVDPSVVHWEDHGALVAPDNGLALIKEIITHAPTFLRSNKELVDRGISNLYIEIGYKQGKSVVDLMQQAGFTNIVIEQDLQGHDRVVKGSAVDATTEKKSARSGKHSSR